MISMSDIKKTAIIVLGMHRSGTSLLSGCLHLLGVNLGKTLVPPDKSDEAGYFENQGIVLIHDILFRDLGCRWDMIGNLPDGWLDGKAALQAEKKLMSLIERELLGDRPWAVKDPRICRLMPLWKRILDRMKILPSFVVLVRHPFEVAKSLEKRDQSDLMKGHLLWMVHYRDALNVCLEYSPVMVTYDQLLADPLSTLQRISRVLDIPFPKDIQSHYPSIINFVRPELKHHQSSHGPGAGAGGVFSPYDWIYQQFRLVQVQAIDYQPTNQPDSNGFELKDHNTSDARLSIFPMIASVRTPTDSKFERNHATAMFNNLLGVIGRYERADMHDSIRRERALLNAGQSGGSSMFAQVFFPGSHQDSQSPYSEENSLKILLAPDEWEKLSIPLPRPDLLKAGRLRFDPLNMMGMVLISSIRILNAATGQIVWPADPADAFMQCTATGDAFSLSRPDSLELVCIGSDPRLLLPEIPDVQDCPLTLEVWIKVSRHLKAFQKIWLDLTRADFENKNRIEALTVQLAGSNAECNRAADQLAALRQQKADIESETEVLRQQKADIESEAEVLRKELGSRMQSMEESQRQWLEQDDRKDRELAELRQQKLQVESDAAEVRKELEQQLHSQQALTREYYSELKKAENQLSDQKERIDNLNNVAEERMRATEILSRQIKENASLKDKTIQELKNEMEWIYVQRKQETENQWREKAYFLNISQLSKWLRQIENDYLSLKKSLRWKIGNVIIRSLELMLFRRKQPMVTDHLEQLFQERRLWLPRFGHGKQDQEHLTDLMRQTKNDLDALIRSRRWRIGHGIVSILERLLLRGKPPLAIDHMRSVCDEYVQWVVSLNGSSKKI
jgi:hypothetical protein